MLLDPRSTQCGSGIGPRLTAFSERRWADMLLHLANPTTTPRRHASERVQQERKEELAGRLVAKGQVSRAYTALTSKAQLATSASTKAMLASKHPARTRRSDERREGKEGVSTCRS